ncbi:WD40 repeat domain-containing protein [Candidatus Peribacteria bacterium]|nr:WD40 repeat domain-containing protein [Candidatus Peribacteria bacterium]
MPPLQKLHSADIGDHVIGLRWSPNGAFLAAASISGPIHIFRGSDLHLLHQLTGHGLGTTAIDWHPTLPLLASAGQDGNAKLWDVESGTEKTSMPCGMGWVEHVTWSDDGETLATSCGKKVILWNADGTKAHTFPDFQSTIADIAWRPHHMHLAAAGYNGVLLYPTEKDGPPEKLLWKGSTLVCVWSPNGKMLATGDQDCTVQLWYPEIREHLQMHGYMVKALQLSWTSDSKFLATGGGIHVTIWDCAGKGPEGQDPVRLEGHEELISTLAYQHKGALLASGDEGGVVRVWQHEKAESLLSGLRLDQGISVVTWSPDDALIAVGGATGAVSLLRLP